jgi:hypothetical protein
MGAVYLEDAGQRIGGDCHCMFLPQRGAWVPRSNRGCRVHELHAREGTRAVPSRHVRSWYEENMLPKEDGMKYLLQIYPAEAREALERLPEHEQQAILEEYLAIGQLPGVLGGEQLQPVETATTVRVQDGETLLIDGPFVDAKEHLGGYLLLEVEDLDAALEIAARVPAARMGGAVEVRPLVRR